MAKVVKNISFNWAWTGDERLLRGFNLAICKSGETPLTEMTASTFVVMQGTSETEVTLTPSYTFSNVTLDDGGVYIPFVQAVYPGDDSEWLASTGVLVSDDGEATIVMGNMRIAVLELYQWATAKPDAPTGTSTYTWATREFTLPTGNNGWSFFPGISNPGDILWGTSVKITDSTASPTTEVTWPIVGTTGYQDYTTAITYSDGRAGRINIVLPDSFTEGQSCKWAVFCHGDSSVTNPETGLPYDETNHELFKAEARARGYVYVAGYSPSSSLSFSWFDSVDLYIASGGNQHLAEVIAKVRELHPELVGVMPTLHGFSMGGYRAYKEFTDSANSYIAFSASSPCVDSIEGAETWSGYPPQFDGITYPNGDATNDAAWMNASPERRIGTANLHGRKIWIRWGATGDNANPYPNSGLHASEAVPPANLFSAEPYGINHRDHFDDDAESITGLFNFYDNEYMVFAPQVGGPLVYSLGGVTPSVGITPSRALSYTSTDGVIDAGQEDIVLTATTLGIPSPTYSWTFGGLDSNPDTTNTQSCTITPSNFGESKSAWAKCTVNGDTRYTAIVTIVRLELSTALPGAGSGMNILSAKYSGFEQSVAPVLTPVGCTATIDTVGGRALSLKSLKLAATSGTAYVYFGSSSTDYNLSILPGRKWIVSALVKCSAASKAGRFYMRTATAGTYFYGSFTTSATPDTWTRVSCVIDASADTTSTAGWMSPQHTGGTGVDMWFDDIMMEEQIGAGNTPSAYVAPMWSITDEIQSIISGINLPLTGMRHGLNITQEYLGFYNTDTTGGKTVGWKSYIDSSGNFKFGDGSTGPGIAWNQSEGTLAIRGTLNANDISAGTLNAIDITGGTITGSTIQTAASGRRVRMLTTNETIYGKAVNSSSLVFMNDSTILARIEPVDAGGITMYEPLYAYTIDGMAARVSTNVTCNFGLDSTPADVHDRVGVRGVGYAYFKSPGGYDGGSYQYSLGGSFSGPWPLRIVPAASSGAPTIPAKKGTLVVDSAGVLYINTNDSTTWAKVGSQ